MTILTTRQSASLFLQDEVKRGQPNMRRQRRPALWRIKHIFHTIDLY